MKTFLKDSTILSVFDFQKDEKKFICKMLTGLVTNDEPENFELRLPEFVVMRQLMLSPTEVVEARQKIEHNDSTRLY